jgi:uncharacterized glyoxalase superfamily protein PhnB
MRSSAKAPDEQDHFSMLKNRSVPTDIVLPHLHYQDLEAAIAWLSNVFGFKEHYRYGDPVSGAQLYLGNAWLMVSTERPHGKSPATLGGETQSLTIFIEDIEAHYARTKAAGANIVEEPNETIYGEYQYAAYDLEGHHWLFSRHARDLSPEDWGAKVAAK